MYCQFSRTYYHVWLMLCCKWHVYGRLQLWNSYSTTFSCNRSIIANNSMSFLHLYQRHKKLKINKLHLTYFSSFIRKLTSSWTHCFSWTKIWLSILPISWNLVAVRFRVLNLIWSCFRSVSQDASSSTSNTWIDWSVLNYHSEGTLKKERLK